MSVINLRIPQSMDYVGRVVSIVRRAKVTVRAMDVEMKDAAYEVNIQVEGPADEIKWLVAKLDKLPEVLEIREIPIQAAAVAAAVTKGNI